MKPCGEKYHLALLALFIAFCLVFSVDSFGQTETSGFPSDDSLLQINSIALAGNKITKDQILLREMILKPGDFINPARLDTLLSRSRENLMNTLLFNYVEISVNVDEKDSNLLNISVEVVERWYIWPIPILKISDRNFNVWWQTKDLSRLSYGFYIDWRNFRGRKENLITRFQWGYGRNLSIQYLVPYLNRKKTMGLGFGAGYSRQKETAYRTMYNKQEFFKEPDDFAREDVFAFGQFLLRKNIYTSHQFELRYDQHHFSDSLVQKYPDFTSDSSSQVRYLTFNYMMKFDHRDFKSYPLKGSYADLSVIKYGLWTFNENTLNTFSILATYRKYFELSPRVFFATGLNGQISAGLQPYFILKGIGYDRDIVRSYEYYLVDAQHFAILKNNIKFSLLQNRDKKIDFIRTEKFSRIYYAMYLNVFFDAGYGYYDQDFGTETNDLQNALLMGYGTGLDFVTYYDVVIRLEFSMNFKNEAGVYLHFRAPI